MAVFAPDNRYRSEHHKQLYAAYEVAFTIVDFAAAILFTVGSVLFLYASLQTPAIWCFIVGSACFALKPTIRLTRELHYLRMGDVDDVAAKLKL